MPQLTLEFSPNVIEKHTFPTLFETCHTILANNLPTDLKSCKSRSIEASTYRVGDGNLNNAFIHVSLKVKSGRSKETLQTLGHTLINTLKTHFEDSVQKLNLQITLEIMELQDTYFSL